MPDVPHDSPPAGQQAAGVDVSGTRRPTSADPEHVGPAPVQPRPPHRRLTLLNAVLTLIALAATVVMIGMGFWQLSMFDTRQHEDAAAMLERKPVPIGRVMGPDDPFPGDGIGKPVTLEGTYQPRDTFIVQPRGGRPTLVTPLLLDTGSMMLVQRGYGGDLHTPVPSGRVTVSGFLEPNTADVRPLDLDRRTTGIDTATLVNEFDRDVYSAYVVADTQTPTSSLTPVDPPLPDPGIWAGLRNLLYAVQWWLFAAFAVYMWWEIVIKGPRPEPSVEQTPTTDEHAGTVG